MSNGGREATEVSQRTSPPAVHTPVITALRRHFRANRNEIADQWQGALAPTSFVPFGWQEVGDRLVALVERVLDTLCAEPFDRRQADAIGTDLALLHYIHPDALSATEEVLGAAIVAGLSPVQVVAVQPRLTALLGGIAAGFLRQVHDQTLAEQEAIRAVFAEAAIGIGLADLEGRITDVLHREEVPAAWAMYGEMMAGQRRIYHAEQRHLRKDGRLLWCDLTVSIVHDAAGTRPLGCLFAFRDVTREREVDRMKSEFVALVSHELRTPLTSIKGYVDLLLAGNVGELAGEQREFLEIVVHNADRLTALIDDLLDLARIESGRIDLTRTPLDLGRLLSDLGAAFHLQIESKEQRLVVDLAPDLPALWGDAARVAQILINLLSNAHKYTPAGGVITVVARPDGAMVRIEVRDTGIGMTADEQSQLFTRFFRAKNRATQEVGGTGLGLAIMRSLVQLHGGWIDVDSALGQGSTFTVTLPSLARPAEAPSVLSPPRPGGRVLVVDDEPEIGLLLRRYLERAGYTVAEAHSTDAALRLARSEQPALITMDIRMPDADGFTALEWLKGDPTTANIPVVLISVLKDSGRGRLLGAVDHVAKPVEERVLLERVAAALAGASRRLVLVADDDADARQLLAHLLRRQGYEVVEASDGAEAVALVHARRPDLALLDVRMPGTDGFAALAALRSDPATRDLPVIMLTASPGTLADGRPEAERLGGVRLVAKPSSAEELAATIGAAFASDEPGSRRQQALPSGQPAAHRNRPTLDRLVGLGYATWHQADTTIVY